ncbi:3-carboxy-cis,cis-muconate cycloisomerase [Kribbella albertanoniae]|uniref:Adenylosuccinate lyase n=1 Tax=Kribbella albertanoniae TaxID=1266829 RepID=A0A4R4P1C1_9ACTN|nr:lyase family protein [Kribbella albertanoniae]TDC14423.1 adenylosuccinate lyase [Kribbella albertanoniae]
MSDLLEPGHHRAAGLGDDGLWHALLQVERAWLLARSQSTGSLDAAIANGVPRPAPEAVENAGSPVVELVRILRSMVDDETAQVLHRGLTSQDVLDTALMLLAKDALGRADTYLTLTAAALAELARAHRETVMAGRTLTQYAVPVTFGLKVAQWLIGVLDARDAVRGVELPVQVGGAAGTRSLLGELTDVPDAVVDAFAAELGLQSALPWHTRRTPITRVADVMAEACAAAGVIAGNILFLGRPEVGEVREARSAGKGTSSTMPQKANPVLSVLVRSAALQVLSLVAHLHMCSGLAVDERPDGAWHAEWPAFTRVLTLGVTALSQTADLVGGLEVDADVMSHRAQEAAVELLAERGTGDDPAEYLGSATAFVDRVLERWDRG